MRGLYYFIMTAIAALLTAPAHATWHEASSEHFIIYANQSEKQLRTFAEDLEKYHAAMSAFTGKGMEEVSPSNRVTIFVMRNTNVIRRLYGDRRSSVAGFFSPRAGGSVAFVPEAKGRNRLKLSFNEIVLLHEYAHHFMASNYPFSFPLWYQEGFAEFYGAAGFDKDGSVWLGRPAQHRSAELFRLSEVPINFMFDTAAYKEYAAKDGKGYDSFYGRSWLMFHYLTMEEVRSQTKRKGQLSLYLSKLVNGENALQSAKDAFGDLDVLDDDLEEYLEQRRINAFKIPPENVAIDAVNIRRLSKGANEVMFLLAQSRRGVDDEQAAKLIDDVRAVAAQYPNDPFVLAALAEAEYDSGNDTRAVAAADMALSLEPKNSAAHKQKIFALYRMAEIAEESEEADAKPAWKTLQQAITAANAAENDNPIPLMYFYRSYLAREQKPPQMAKDALEQALGLAPYDTELRLAVAQQQINDGLYSYARYTLKPMLLDPHNTGKAAVAQKILASIEDREDRAAKAENAKIIQ